MITNTDKRSDDYSVIDSHTENHLMKEKFLRIAPIVGDTLFSKRVAIVGRYGTAKLAELLACCGIGYFDIYANRDDQFINTDCALTALIGLQSRLEIDIDHHYFDMSISPDLIQQHHIDLIIARGGEDDYKQVLTAINVTGKRGIFYTLTSSGAGILIFIFPQENIKIPQQIFSHHQPVSHYFNNLHLTNIVANYSKGFLLQGTDYARSDIDQLISNGTRILMAGHQSWPWAMADLTRNLALLNSLSSSLVNNNSEEPCISLSDDSILVIGLGSLGSVIADNLNQLKANLVLIDGENVDLANPIRQRYGMRQVGGAKASSTLDNLTINRLGAYHQIADDHWRWQEDIGDNQERKAQHLDAYQFHINSDEDLNKLSQIMQECQIKYAIIATGTAYDRAISQHLKREQLPHIIVSCYARAQFFEAMVITEKGPCFGCVRGHLYVGHQPTLTPEQRARYISNDHDLQAEPATAVETSYAANLATHLLFGLIKLDDQLWLKRAIAEEEIFFLGGNISEEMEDGARAYNIDLPNEVRLYGIQDITGRGDYVECWDCGRQLPVSIKYEENILTFDG